MIRLLLLFLLIQPLAASGSSQILTQLPQHSKYLDGLEKEQAEALRSIPTIAPLKARISSKYGRRRNPITKAWRFHRGVDYAASKGTPVCATADGHVTFAGYTKSFGYLVVLQHRHGICTKYAHNSKLCVKRGDKVTKGTSIISCVGSTGHSTGAHLHYEIIVNDRHVDPISYIEQFSLPRYNLAQVGFQYHAA